MNLLHADAGPKTLARLTALTFLAWALKYLVTPLGNLADLPAVYYEPVGALRWVPKAWVLGLGEGGWLAARLAVVGCCLLSARPAARARYAMAASVALIVFIESAVRGFGHVNHCEVGMLLVTMTLTAFRFADAPPRPGENLHAAPLVVGAVLFSLTYAFVGLTRLVVGLEQGFAAFGSDTIVKHALDQGHHDWLIDFGWGRDVYDYREWFPVFRLGFLAFTVVELLAPLCLASRRFRQLFVPTALLFHASALFIMNIPFFESVVMLPFLIEWNQRR